ncbi:MAG TPA: T9SS type A sorting domain-containing protein, partial [Bacteroidia bacterium]
NSNYTPKATSISIDNFYGNKRLLMADPINGTLRSRILYTDGSSNFDYKESYLVDSSITANAAFDFIDSDTTFNLITVSSETTGKLGVVSSGRMPDGTEYSFINSDLITSMINPVQPVGMITTKFGSSYQFWIADRGQNKLIRAFIYNYQITPPLPEGLTFNNNTGKIEGSPKAASSPQTYQIVMASPLGNDTTYVTFAITPSTGVSNAVGTSTTAATHKDGVNIKYFDPYTCSSLVELKDEVGGTSPGSTEVTQYVRPSVTTVGNKTFVRRSTTITSEQNENINGSLKLMYSYEDINQYNIANPTNLICNTAGTNCNDTVAGEIMVSVLQMHESVNTVTGFLGKDPIIHNPVRATWNANLHMWVTDNIILDKLSDFYAGPTSNATGFDCTNEGADTLSANDYYVWIFDTLFTSGDYIDTLVNTTGCDSIARLNLTINNTIGLSESASSNSIRLFPNPSKDVLNLMFTNNAIVPEKVRIVNILGNEVYNNTVSGDTQIDITSFNSGIYFVSVDTKDKTFVYRIIKE